VGSVATEGGLAEGRDLMGEMACVASTHNRRRFFPSHFREQLYFDSSQLAPSGMDMSLISWMES